jgi:hypothetical protein
MIREPMPLNETTWTRVARLTVSFASTPGAERLSLPAIQGNLIALACTQANGGAGAIYLFEKPASGDMMVCQAMSLGAQAFLETSSLSQRQNMTTARQGAIPARCTCLRSLVSSG